MNTSPVDPRPAAASLPDSAETGPRTDAQPAVAAEQPAGVPAVPDAAGHIPAAPEAVGHTPDAPAASAHTPAAHEVAGHTPDAVKGDVVPDLAVAAVAAIAAQAGADAASSSPAEEGTGAVASPAPAGPSAADGQGSPAGTEGGDAGNGVIAASPAPTVGPAGDEPASSSEPATAAAEPEPPVPAPQVNVVPRDAEEAQHALAEVQLLLERYAFALDTARYYPESVQQQPPAKRKGEGRADGKTGSRDENRADGKTGSRDDGTIGNRDDGDARETDAQTGAHADRQQSGEAADGTSGTGESAREQSGAGMAGSTAADAGAGSGAGAGAGAEAGTDDTVDADEPVREPEGNIYLTQLRERLASLHAADIAYVLEALPPDERRLVWDSVKREVDGAVLLEVSEPVREALIDSMTEAELVAAVKDLDADDVADLAEHLPPAVVEKVQHELTPEEREQLRTAMSYPDDSVGARMDFEFVRVREDVTLEVVLRYLRRFDELPQHTDQVFVVDRNGILMGSLSIEQVLINEPDTEVSAVMHRDVLSLDADDEVGEAAQAFERYDLISAPVVDPHHKLIGRLTIDEVVDVIREESDADALNQAGLRDEEDLFGSVWQSARNRWLWLAVNLVTAFLASRVIGIFNGTIEKVVALATLMPIVAGLAGNSGNQTMALMIRSLAQGQITGSNFGRLLRKELTVALLNGVVWGLVAGCATWALYHDSKAATLLGVAMAVAILLNLLIGALLGVIVPFALDRLGRDPALGSSVLLTFSTDGLGFMIFLGLATMLF